MSDPSILWKYTKISIPRPKIDKRQQVDALEALGSVSGSRFTPQQVEEAKIYYRNALTYIKDTDESTDDESDSDEIFSCPQKHIRQSQIRLALGKVSRGLKVVIPPKYDKNKNGKCNCKVPIAWQRDPQKIHLCDMNELKKFHLWHIGTKGPNSYHEMYKKMRQHLCFFHNISYYDIPLKRRKKTSKQTVGKNTSRSKKRRSKRRGKRKGW